MTRRGDDVGVVLMTHLPLAGRYGAGRGQKRRVAVAMHAARLFGVDANGVHHAALAQRRLRGRSRIAFTWATP